MNQSPKIAILRWESGFVPQGLMQLETMAGNSTNPASYPFPVRLVEVKGACVETVITHPSRELLQSMIAICRQLKEEGVQAVTTSCGFNAIFQKELATMPAYLFSPQHCCRCRSRRQWWAGTIPLVSSLPTAPP